MSEEKRQEALSVVKRVVDGEITPDLLEEDEETRRALELSMGDDDAYTGHKYGAHV